MTWLVVLSIMFSMMNEFYAGKYVPRSWDSALSSAIFLFVAFPKGLLDLFGFQPDDDSDSRLYLQYLIAYWGAPLIVHMIFLFRSRRWWLLWSPMLLFPLTYAGCDFHIIGWH